MEEEISEIAQNAVDAFSYDHPEVFWIYNVKYSYRISGQSTETGCLVKIVGITLKPQEVIMKPIIKYENYCERKREKENKNSKVETEKTYACKLCI